MPSSDLSLDVELQKLYLSTSLNSTLMYFLLMGMYSGVYLATMLLYSSNAASHKRTIVAVLTAGYLTLVGQTAIKWYLTLELLVLSGGATRASQASLILDDSTVPNLVFMLRTIFYAVGYALADGLMIWRCFHACGRSLRAIVGPLLFYFIEIGAMICSNTFSAIGMFTNSDKLNTMGDIADGVMSVAVALTSLLATCVIIRRIYSATSTRTLRNSGTKETFGRYTHIVEILIQSAAAYSLLACIKSVLDFVQISPASTVAFIFSYYFARLADIIPAFATTLMVGRLELTSSLESEAQPTYHSSNLQFLDVSQEMTSDETYRHNEGIVPNER